MLRVSRQLIAWCLQGSPAKKNFCSAMSEYNTVCQKWEESRGLSMHTQDIQPKAVHKFVIWSYCSRSSTTPTLCKNYVMEGRGLSCLPRRSVGDLVGGVATAIRDGVCAQSAGVRSTDMLPGSCRCNASRWK